MADYTIQGSDRRWQRFEKLVARMLATLSADEIVYDDNIRGALSEADRQIDVSLRSRSSSGIEQLVIVQCRDYKNPLDVNDVGEFDAVIRDVGAAKGVMVSVHGWTETARTYARNLNLDLLRLVDAENKIWAEYFGAAPPTFRQVVKAPTLVTHRSLEISFSLHTSRLRPRFSMPYHLHDAALVHADGSSAGTPLNVVGKLWADEEIPHEPGEGFVIVDLAQPVYFAIDQSRTPICRIMFHARVVKAHRFGLWELAKMEGLADDLAGTVLSCGFTTTPFNIEDVLTNWEEVASPDRLRTRPTMRLTTAGGWDVDESVQPPAIAAVRGVSDRDFREADAVCP